jgi:hypothetical protein
MPEFLRDGNCGNAFVAISVLPRRFRASAVQVSKNTENAEEMRRGRRETSQALKHE